MAKRKQRKQRKQKTKKQSKPAASSQSSQSSPSPLTDKIEQAIQRAVDDAVEHFNDQDCGGWPLNIRLIVEQVVNEILGYNLEHRISTEIALRTPIVEEHRYLYAAADLLSNALFVKATDGEGCKLRQPRLIRVTPMVAQIEFKGARYVQQR